MRLEVNISKKYFLFGIFVLLTWMSVFVVYAYGTSNPSYFGHTAGEISGLNISTGGSFDLGNWESKSADSAYQASSDGFVVATAQNGGSGTTLLTLFSDSSSNPSTVRAKQTAESDNFVSVTIPIKSGDYWKVTSVGGSPTNTVYWIPA